MLEPMVSIIIPSFNEGAWLSDTVRACLEKTDYPNFEIVVVADACTDGSVEVLRSLKFPNVVIVELATNAGAIVTRNKGARVANGEILVFIDSHQEPITPNWLSELVRLLQKPNCGAATITIADLGQTNIGGFLYALKNWTLEPTWIKPRQPQEVQLTGAVPGGCFAIKKDRFIATGGFNSNLKKWGREDFEYSLRLWRMGHDLWFSPHAQMGHAFNHKRQFSISWEQVDFNTLWIAKTLMDKASYEQVRLSLEARRPENLKKVQRALKQCASVKGNKWLTPFTRDFEIYKNTFNVLKTEPVVVN